MRASFVSRALVAFAGVLVVTGCTGVQRDDDGAGLEESGILPMTSGTSSDPSADDNGVDSMEKLDMMGIDTDGNPCAEGAHCDECVPLQHSPCDAGTTDLFNAMGINCPGELQVMTQSNGSGQAMGVRTAFGPTGEWNPREGSAYAVLGSGLVSELDNETPPGDSDVIPTHCNDDLGAEFNMGGQLPAPLRTNDVGGDCTENPALLGTGDCSNTIQGQFDQGGSANDYTELRINAQVPPSNNSFSYDFAFFSTEYPAWYNSAFNDMYVGWLESESWTGNISFDQDGEPISLNAGFLDFRDDGGFLPEFGGTCMKRHAGTRWLSTTAPVTPGEDITIVFAIFDLSDSILDSYVFLDNFQWGCDGEETPKTTPVG
jgi:hypothetical protein